MAIKSYPSVGEAYADVTFALGFALTQWHTIEHKLYQLFVYLCGNSDEKALNAIFHEMPLESRLRALTELVRLRDEKSLSAWDDVLKQVTKQKRLRDKLAHWTVETGPHKDGGFTAWLSPPSTDERAKIVFENVQNALGADDLKIKCMEFLAASHAIHGFMMVFPKIA
ncbi:hypothetical protein [Bradyrhizobium sp.]|uniref:hypothetical protein n=1 Tax=Bradyrhizobium sp. TaxID=376 RepID=UPI00271F412C|nr:hypothetical protein [Bradyrhizobium sp.]MDO9296536.1 hypothetical protein [Bradyrhizobium sp.]